MGREAMRGRIIESGGQGMVDARAMGDRGREGEGAWNQQQMRAKKSVVHERWQLELTAAQSKKPGVKAA
jgi:hypothetical protein